MHVQPEAATIRIADKPLWAPGAPAAIERFVAARGAGVRILEFGSGGSTMFLLRAGAIVTTVEHHVEWADALRREAEAHGLAGNLTLLRRDRPYSDVAAEFAEDLRFDILLVDGRERVACLRNALRRVKDDGLVLLDDSQRPRYWPAFAILADKPCVTYESTARNTTIWSLGDTAADANFVRKSMIPAGDPAEPGASALFLPRDFLDGSELEPRYVRHAPIDDLKNTERDLQKIGLIEHRSTFLSPSLYDLSDASVRIDAGRKLLGYRGAVFREKAGEFSVAEDVAPFVGAVDLPGKTLDLTASGAARYSFFLLASLPKLEIARASGLSLADFDTVLVNSGAPWLKDLLHRAGVDGTPAIRCFNKLETSFRMEQSVHIEGIRAARFTPRWVYSYLDRLFADDETAPRAAAAPSFGEYVYISRQRSEGRRILNQDALMELIEPLGFREIFAEDYSPLELATALARVKVILSPHGAGLANIIFCPKSARVIELFASHFTPQYFHLARDMGQDYLALACVDAHGLNVFDRYTARTANKAEFNREDIVVPVAKLKEALARVGCVGRRRWFPWRGPRA